MKFFKKTLPIKKALTVLTAYLMTLLFLPKQILLSNR